MTARSTLLAAPLLTLLAVGTASATELSVDQRLERARLCYSARDLRCAERELLAARALLAAQPLSKQIQVLRLSAETALSNARPADARRHIDALLRLDADFDPGKKAWPPEWRRILEDKRRALPDTRPPELNVSIPLAAEHGKPIVIKATVQDPSGVAHVTMFVAAKPPVAVPLATTDGKQWTVAVPGDLVAGTEVAVWIEAFDTRGNGPARWGSETRPHRIRVVASEKPPGNGHKPPPSTPVYEKWWFWTAIGAGLAAATTVIYFATLPEDDISSPSTRIRVEVAWD